ncbi:hypothetical protein [Paenibacillus xanthanilyticus]|uniref:Uncharacterized protein n=1 Tax=Paenibacillus xanthanilyticus TaxID=1783531 RepID=A0ABV8JYQ2_9BACL
MTGMRNLVIPCRESRSIERFFFVSWQMSAGIGRAASQAAVHEGLLAASRKDKGSV